MKKENFRFYWEKPAEERKPAQKNLPAIKFEVPGFRKDEIKVQLESNMITVSAQKNSSSEKKTKNSYIYSSSASAFSRNMSLPYEINPKEFKILISDGAVTLKKKKKVRQEN